MTNTDHEERGAVKPQSQDGLLRRIAELQARLDERERQLAEALQMSASKEREAARHLTEARSQIGDLESYIFSWHNRHTTKAIWAWDAASKHAADYVAPPGTLRGQTLGYAGVTVRMTIGAALKALRKTANVVVNHDRPPAGSAGAALGEDVPTDGQSGSGGVDSPLISVILPVYNAMRWDAGYLTDALQSIADQTYRTFELIVVDDGSTDGSGAVVRQFVDEQPDLAITCLSKENGGQSSARNLGARHAKAEWIAFLDQDDLFFPNRLETVIPFLRPGVDLVYTDADTIDEKGQVERAAIHMRHRAGGKQPKTCVEDALFEDVFVMPGVMTMRKELFERIGGFDELLSGYEDDDLYLRAIQANCRIDYVPVATLRWRIYGGNYSRSRRMVDSRMYFWRKLLRDFANDGADKASARRITLRFFRQCLTQCAMMLEEGDPLAADNLEAAVEMLPEIGAVDRAAFRLTEWAWQSRGRVAYHARWWFLRGLQGMQP